MLICVHSLDISGWWVVLTDNFFVSLHFMQSKCRISASPARTTAPYALTSALVSWRSWRRSSTSASTWRGRGASRSPPRWSSTRHRWRSGSRTDAWSRKSASARAAAPRRAHPPHPGLIRSWRTPTTPPRLPHRARPRARRRRLKEPPERKRRPIGVCGGF